MAVSTNSDFVDFIIPLRERMELYDKTSSPFNQPKNDHAREAVSIPPGFIDAMIVREAVYVKEQGVPLENEFDDEDAVAFHWVAYASVPGQARRDPKSPDMKPVGEKINAGRRASAGTRVPIGTIRMIPVPYNKVDAETWKTLPAHKRGLIHKSGISYVKLGRLAVIKEYRKAGISKLLINMALDFVKNHPWETFAYYDKEDIERARAGREYYSFSGFVLVHSQVGVEKVWHKYGFGVDPTMGKWEEEGIEHVGMMVKLDVEEKMRKNRTHLPGGPS